MITVIWANEAKSQYFKILSYLYLEWGEQAAEDFETRIIKVETLISSGIVKFPFSKVFEYEKCVIDHYNSLIFKRNENYIEIVALLDNRTAHQF